MINLRKLKEVYNFTRELKISDVNALVNASRRRSFEKKDLLIEKGSKSNEIFLVTEGLIRCYKMNKQGEDITLALYPEYHIVPNVDYVLNQEGSRFYYEVIEKTKTLSLDYDFAVKILSKNEALSKNEKYVYIMFMRKMFKRIETFVFHSPEERYKLYVKEYPSIVNRVPDKYIANIIGVTPVSLSRIRSRITNR